MCKKDKYVKLGRTRSYPIPLNCDVYGYGLNLLPKKSQTTYEYENVCANHFILHVFTLGKKVDAIHFSLNELLTMTLADY
jgi:hypothetical protein